jgi:hypothetical protein
MRLPGRHPNEWLTDPHGRSVAALSAAHVAMYQSI